MDSIAYTPRGTLSRNRPLADLTWLRVGGPADCKPPPTRPGQPMPEELPGLPLMVIFASLRRLPWGVPF